MRKISTWHCDVFDKIKLKKIKKQYNFEAFHNNIWYKFNPNWSIY